MVSTVAKKESTAEKKATEPEKMENTADSKVSTEQ